MSKLVTAAMLAHASVLLINSAKWARGIDKRSNRAFVCFSSSRTDREGRPIYWQTAVDGSLCSCTSFLHRGICCHAVACRTEAERARFKARAVATEGEVDLMMAEVGTRVRGNDAAAAYDRVISRWLGE